MPNGSFARRVPRRPSAPRRQALGWAAALGAAVSGGTAGCGSVVDPPLPGGAGRFTPPPVYARWWAMTEACSGLRRDIGEVAWYVIPGALTFTNPGSGHQANGYYSRPGSQLVLAGQAQLDGAVVRHEMLHALLRTASGHPRAQYLERCAGVVKCEQACVADAGPAPSPPAGALVVTPSALVVRAALSNAAPGASRDEGWFTFTVTVANPADVPVVVRLTSASLPYSFGYRVTTDPPRPPVPGELGAFANSVRPWDASAVQFAPGEVKRHVFDFRVLRTPAVDPDVQSGDGAFAPGAYLFRGTFGSGDAEVSSPTIPVTLAP